MEVDNVQCDVVFFVQHVEALKILKDITSISKRLIFGVKSLDILVAEYDEEKLLADLASKVTNLDHIISGYTNLQTLLHPYVDSLTRDVFSLLADFVQLPPSERSPIISTTDGRKTVPLIALEHLCYYLYTVGKCVGVRRLISYAPNDVKLFEKVTTVVELVQSNANVFDATIMKYDDRMWCLEYILLAWESLLVYSPFDLKLIWSNPEDPEKTFQGRIMSIAMHYLNQSTKARDAAAIVISNLFSRPDIIKSPNNEIGIFLSYCYNILVDPSAYGFDDNTQVNGHVQIGVLTVFKQILKHVSREDLSTHLNLIEGCLLGSDWVPTTCASRKLKAGCLGRLAVHLLPPQSVFQRYRRQCKKLLSLSPHNNGFDVNNDEILIDPRVEIIVAQLLDSLVDKDIRVRWASAKAIGRTSVKLPMVLNNQIIDHVIGMIDNQSEFGGFNSTIKSEATVHGGCLAIAEIIRNGILHPNMLDKVLSCTKITLSFDVWRGKGSAGTAVRDASCYICWSIARNFTDEMIKPHHIVTLSKELVNVALFDVSINCRRAAGAALQELVGRLNGVPHGLDLITIADYYSVSNRKKAFIQLSHDISKFGFYTMSMVDNLFKTKLYHPDIVTRELAAIALGEMALHSVNFSDNCTNIEIQESSEKPIYLVLIEKLLANVMSPILSLMHGSLCGLTQILLGLARKKIHLEQYFEDICVIPVVFEKKRLFRGRGGNIIRESTCRLIGAICKFVEYSNTYNDKSENFSTYIVILKDCIRNFSIDVQVAAVEAMTQLFMTINPFLENECIRLKDYLMRSLNNKADHVAARRGYALSLAAIPLAILQDRNTLEDIIHLLCDEITLNVLHDAIRDAQTRQFALLSLFVLSERASHSLISPKVVEKIVSTLVCCCNDYEVDSRGDVGSWVRDLACEFTVYVLSRYLNMDDAFFSHIDCKMATDLVRAIIGLSLENLEHTRARATFLFSHFLVFDSKFRYEVDWVWRRVFYGGCYEYKISNADVMKEFMLSKQVDLVQVSRNNFVQTMEGNSLLSCCSTNGRSLEGLETLKTIAFKTISTISQLYDIRDLNIHNLEDGNAYCFTKRSQKVNMSLRIPGWSRAPLTFGAFLWVLIIPSYTVIAINSIVKIIGSNHTNEVLIEGLSGSPICLEHVFVSFIRENKNHRMRWQGREQVSVQDVILECIINIYQSMITAKDFKGCCRVTNTIHTLCTHDLIDSKLLDSVADLVLNEAKVANNYAYLKSIIKCLQGLYASKLPGETANEIMEVLLWFLQHKYPTLRVYTSSALVLILNEIQNDKIRDEALELFSKSVSNNEERAEISERLQKLLMKT